MGNYSRLVSSSGSFSAMLEHGFGVPTVMDVVVYDYEGVKDYFSGQTAEQIVGSLKADSVNKRCTIDTLKISNITVDGPSRTASGGKYANPLIKYGKTARIEMQDALGHKDAIDYLCGGVVEYDTQGGNAIAIHNGQDFNKEVTILGTTFYVDKESGQQVEANIVIYKMLPDSIFNLTQEAEGDFSVFDLNGDLMPQTITVGHADGENYEHDFFYSIVGAQEGSPMTANADADDTSITVTNAPASSTIIVSVDGGSTWNENSGLTLTAGSVVKVRAIKDGKVVALADCVVAAA